jgi:dihydrofolate synthase/folylpolyglutamate synthase
MDPSPSDHGWVFAVSGIHDEYSGLDLRLRGRHQVTNFTVAVAAVEALFDRSLDEAAVRETAARVTSPGRLEVLGREPWLITDGAHNPAGMETLAAALRQEFAGIAWTVVFGAMGDKDVAAMLDALEGRVAVAHTAAADSPRAMGATEVAGLITERLGIPATPHASVSAAVAAARASGTHVLITGSLYVVGEARAALGVA